MHVVIVWYEGDFREAFHRLMDGGQETYHDERYLINVVIGLMQIADRVTFLCCNTSVVYDEMLQPRLRSIGAGIEPFSQCGDMIKLLSTLNPTRLVLSFPSPRLFNWAAKHRIRTLAALADSFCSSRLRDRFRYFRLRQALNHPNTEWIGNHGINACRSLEGLGVNSEKLISWDMKHSTTPAMFSIKTLPNRSSWKLFYAGIICEEKGVPEILHAIAQLRQRHHKVELQLAGRGKVEQFQALARQLGVSQFVEFLGHIANSQVLDYMRQADAVLVPSRYDYSEGLPFTIYEALCARTPIVASDHPMFVGNLQHDISAMLFPAEDAIAFADQIEQLLTHPDRYERISRNSLETWERLQSPVKWEDLVRRWLSDTPADQRWLFEHRLVALHQKAPTDPVST